MNQDVDNQLGGYEPDITKCPKCGGDADNGYDRCEPPNPYYCTKCSRQIEKDLKLTSEEAYRMSQGGVEITYAHVACVKLAELQRKADMADELAEALGSAIGRIAERIGTDKSVIGDGFQCDKWKSLLTKYRGQS